MVYIILESVVERGFVENLSVPSTAAYAVNGDALNKNDHIAGCAEIFDKSMWRECHHPMGDDEIYK
jgi:hypothetical protein